MYIEPNIALHKMKTNQWLDAVPINLKSSFISAYVSNVQGFLFKILSLIFKIKYYS